MNNRRHSSAAFAVVAALIFSAVTAQAQLNNDLPGGGTKPGRAVPVGPTDPAPGTTISTIRPVSISETILQVLWDRHFSIVRPSARATARRITRR